MNEVVIFWFRRDLRLDDNIGLGEALKSGFKILPLFILDNEIVDELDGDDPRISFIFENLHKISESIKAAGGSGMLVRRGAVDEILEDILSGYKIRAVYANKDFEPYSISRDSSVSEILKSRGIPFNLFVDHLLFHPDEVLKEDGNPYTVYTPYSRKWLAKYYGSAPEMSIAGNLAARFSEDFEPDPIMPEVYGFRYSKVKVKPYDIGAELLANYDHNRNIPSVDGTSRLGPHLRFGTVSIRMVAALAATHSETFLKELVWREFFAQVLYHYPGVVTGSFRSKYDRIEWRNNEYEFESWCNGTTGFPMVDAGMRELNSTGYMHNRVRMITAGFLTKNLLIDWRWGEAYFARRLLDYELSSNNGNWQWAAGTGCDAAPYFRIFNPAEQQKKFDPNHSYIRRWIPEFGTGSYPDPIVDHQFARKRTLKAYSAII